MPCVPAPKIYRPDKRRALIHPETLARRVASRARDFSLWPSRKYSMKNAYRLQTAGRKKVGGRGEEDGGGRQCISTRLREISSRFMITVCIWVGQSVFRPLGRNPGALSFAPALSRSRSNLESNSNSAGLTVWPETRNRLAPITTTFRRHSDPEMKFNRRAAGGKNRFVPYIRACSCAVLSELENTLEKKFFFFFNSFATSNKR